jgi:ABC-type transport system involved in multi-copper enzyme maturation permease subunit
MISALRYELVRARTVRSTWIGLVVAFLIALLLGYLIATPGDFYDDSGNLVGTSLDWLGAFTFPLSATAIVAAVLASQAIGQEYRFGIVRLTLSAFPRRGRILTAKVLVVLLLTAAVTVVSLLGSYLAVVLRGYPSAPDTAPAPDSTYVLRAFVFMALFALSAFALAGITRQTAVGVAVPIIAGFIIEPILGAVLTDRADWLVRILPWSTGGRWAQLPPDPSLVEPGMQQLAVGWGALAIFGVWVLVLLALEAWSFLRRDA